MEIEVLIDPGDAALGITNAAVALTGEYRGRRRVTLRYPVANHARRILWVVRCGDKAGMFPRAGDRSIPAGRMRHSNVLILADLAAAESRQPGG
jgi:hypothetical protein